LKCVFSGWLLAAAASAAAAAAEPHEAAAPSDPAAIEAYRRLPYCRLAPDGRHLAEEPCRRPPTRGFAARRTVPVPFSSPLRQAPAVPAATRAAPAAQPAPVVPPPVTLPTVPPPVVQPLNQCDSAGCRGGNGTLYQPGAGNILLDPAGRMCTQHGQWVHCP
jgi:hypothetical protein